MFSRPKANANETSRAYRDGGSAYQAVSRTSRASTGSAAFTSQSSASIHNATGISSYSRNEGDHCLEESQAFHDARDRMDVDDDELSHSKQLARTSCQDQRPVYSSESRGPDEGKPPKDDRRHYQEGAYNSPFTYAKKAFFPPPPSYQQLYEAKSRELNDLKDQHDETLKKSSGYLTSLKDLEYRHDVLKRRYDEQMRKFDDLDRARKVVVDQKQSLETALKQRQSELKGVRQFHTTADAIAGAEVVGKLRKLNEEVQQSTMFMVDWVMENSTVETLPRDETLIKQAKALETLGMMFMHLLGTRNHGDNTLLVELGLRAYLIYELYRIASPWRTGQGQSYGAYIVDIYERMQEKEGQAVSGNWRALTHLYTQSATVNDAELANGIISGLSGILVVAGCATSKSQLISKFDSKFRAQVERFVSLAREVSKMIGVDMVSEDFEVLVAEPGSPFDNEKMEDAYKEGDHHEKEQLETVLIATELGLMKRIRAGASAAKKGEPTESIVIKPRVALESFIDIIGE